MNKGTLKNIILVLLVTSSIVLTFKIWFSEKLWPEGYNFFSNITEKFFSNGDAARVSLEDITKPGVISVNNAPKRSVYSDGLEEYGTIRKTVENAFSDAMGGSFETVDEKEWTNALRSKSVHVAYPVALDSDILSKTLGIKKVSGVASAIKEYLIYSGDMVSSSIYVLIKDYQTNSVFKALSKVTKQEFEDIVSTYATDSVGAIPYSFELNFDKKEEDEELQKLIIAPDVQLMLTSKKYNDIVRRNALLERNGDYNFESIENILKTFGFNIYNAKRYVENDNSMVYVENYGTVKIHQDGLVEYKAVNNEKGLPLSDKANISYDDTVALTVDLVNTMTGAAVGDRNVDLRVISNLVDTNEETINIAFDYYVDGVLASSWNDFFGSRESLKHAVEVTVADSKVISYRQMMSYFRVNDNESENVSSIDALDILLADNDFKKYECLFDLFPCYFVDERGQGKITWGAVLDDSFEIIK